ncbi:MAG: RDD family protein, partial [Phycisphaerae bacterium]|nr:RDD family protein [Phycisphaerae bacterium]
YVKIGDYGLSKFISVSRHSAQTASVGTVHYMAPEIGSGNYHRGIDIYALGVMLYEMLLGRVPYEGSSMGEVLMKHLMTQPEVDELPEPFGRVINKALAKDPKDRYQTVDEMADDLLSVGEVYESLAGFNTVSLTAAVGQRVEPIDSPARSPNPPPPPPVAHPAFAGTGEANRDAGRIPQAVAVGGQRVATPGIHPPTTAQLSPEAAAGNLRYAGFWVRVAAAIIDALIVGAAGAILGGPASGFGLGILYQGFLVGMWNGQTLGKKACGIKVISMDGCPCSLGQAFGRAFAKLISAAILLGGYLMIAFDSRKRGLHDHIAGTLHVYALESGPTDRRVTC